MNRKVVIKKYENRRLYDSATSRYINLDEVAQMVKEGRNVQVVDAATGKDLTRLVLTQIIAEDAKAPDSAFPLDILRQMVIASGKATQESTLKYMRALLEMYQNTYRVMAAPLSPFEFMPAPGGRATASGVAPVPEPSSQEGKEAIEVDELKQRVKELEVVVSRLGMGKKARQRKAQARRRPRHSRP
ncbi:MAG: polyhydroxyalkanoate synthesis regulator DNA-binding domain-containing protein [Candidatus Acidiferrales bacterium]